MSTVPPPLLTHYQALQETVAGLAPQARLMALDLGTKTIGIATSDLTRQIATPVKTLMRRKFTLDAAEILSIASHENVGALILGLPMNMDGSEGPRAQSTRAFMRNISQLTPLPLLLWDERLSTAAVERMLIAADTTRARRSEVVDKLAATWILQSALDSLGTHSPH